MLTHCVLALVLALQGPGGTPPADAPLDPKKIESAVTELTTAFSKDGTPAKRIEAIGKSVEVVDARVIELVAKGLGDKDQGVNVAALDALGRMRHPNSLDALHAYYKREHKKLSDDMTVLPALIKAIGRHGSPSSIALLKEDAFEQRSYLAGQARILALGNIRTNEALEALIDRSKAVGPHRMDGLRNDMRVAIAQLTGLDLGPDSTAWLRWWQDNKKSFEVAKEPPKLEAGMARQWQRYWGVPGKDGEGEEGPARRRGSRGGEGGGKGGDEGGGSGRPGGTPPAGGGGGRGGG